MARRSQLLASVVVSLLVAGCNPGDEMAPPHAPDDTTPPAGVVESTAPPRDRAEPLISPGPLNEDAVGGLLSVYLPQHILEPNFGGEPFCAYDLYGWEQIGTAATAWIWAYCMEYAVSGGELTSGSGISAPIAVRMAESTAGWSITDHVTPGLGSLYADSVRDMFPVEHAERALAPESVAHLAERAEHAARSQLAG